MGDEHMQQPEQRGAERFNFRCEINAKSDHQFFTGFTENISAGGLFISTYQTLELGSRFEMAFEITGINREFKATVEVCWLREYNEMAPQMTPGMGVKFIDLGSQEEQILNEVLKRIDTLFYDTEDL